MRIVDAEKTAPQPFSTHRVGRIENKQLLAGREGAPDNYELSLVLIEGEYSTPRHRHNFDQIRVMLEGRFGFGKDRVQEQGSLGYFAEGVYYTQAAMGPSVTLLYQGAGASGQGFMSYRQLEAAKARLAARGSFAGGVFTTSRDDGGKRNQDAYEAIWEECNGRRLEYPAARYDAPVISDPAAFAWVPAGAGVAIRRIGGFGERGMETGFLRLEAGAIHALEPGMLLYCISGAGAGWQGGCAMATDDAPAELRATAASEFWTMRLPRFAAAESLARAA